jgi:phosphate-selective porin OprO/OprP
MKKKLRKRLYRLSILAAIFLLCASGSSGQETKETPAVTAAKALKLSGYMQFLYTTQDAGLDGFSIRRMRLSLSGDILKNVRAKFEVDAVKSPIFLEGLIEFAFHEAASLRIGQFKVPFSQESVASDADLETINRSQPVLKLSPGQDIGASGRDIGAVVFGKTAILEYTVGVFNGAGINKADTNEQKDWAGRIVVHPASFLAFGASAYDGKYSPSTDIQAEKRDRAGLEMAVLAGPVSLRGEYIRASDGSILKEGWYLQGGYFFMPNKLQGVIKVDSFDPDTRTDFNRINQWTAGLNWLLSGKTKLMVNLEVYKDASGKTTNTAFLAQFQGGF